jgi:hypothetical protein
MYLYQKTNNEDIHGPPVVIKRCHLFESEPFQLVARIPV